MDPTALQVVVAVGNELCSPAMLPEWSQLQTTVEKRDILVYTTTVTLN